MNLQSQLLNYALAEEAFDQWRADRLDDNKFEAILARCGITPASIDAPTVSRALYLYRCDVLKLGVIDSISLVDMILQVEDEMGVDLATPEGGPPEFTTLGELRALIAKAPKT